MGRSSRYFLEDRSNGVRIGSRMKAGWRLAAQPAKKGGQTEGCRRRSIERESAESHNRGSGGTYFCDSISNSLTFNLIFRFTQYVVCKQAAGWRTAVNFNIVSRRPGDKVRSMAAPLYFCPTRLTGGPTSRFIRSRYTTVLACWIRGERGVYIE